MNIEEIKREIELAKDVYAIEPFIMWNVVADKQCLREAFTLISDTWPEARVKTFIVEGDFVVQALFHQLKAARWDGMHLRVSTHDGDPHVLMDLAGIYSIFTVAQPIGDQVWFLDCHNVPDPLPEWAERVEFTEEYFNKHLAQ